jgi:hypothetical protein
MNFNAVALFCEDIRAEKQNTDILVGILSDNIEIPETPGHFPKLAVYTRVVIPIDEPDESLSIVLRQISGEEIQLASFDAAFISKSRANAKALGAPILGLISRGIMAGFPIQEAGRMIVLVRTKSKEVIAGNLNVVLGPNVSTEPAQPSSRLPASAD